jgi:hypothetical protein
MDAVFSKVTSGVQKLTQQTLSEASKVKGKIQEKIIDIQTQDDVFYGSLWEAAEDINSCRGCSGKIKTRKHHCRSCGGVFCDECCPAVIPTSFERLLLPPELPAQSNQVVRICMGCRRGECPSRAMKDHIRKVLDKNGGTDHNKHLERVNAKVNEAMGAFFNDDEEDDYTVLYLRLSRGSFYGENGMANMSGNRLPAVAGYFEFYNKSSEVVAIKVAICEVDPRPELARPSFVAGELF